MSMKEEAIKLGVQSAEKELKEGSSDNDVFQAFIQSFKEVCDQPIKKQDAHAFLLEHSEKYKSYCSFSVPNNLRVNQEV